MKEQSIITVPNKKLIEVTKIVTSFDEQLQNQIGIMRQFLKTDDGAGLAANQIGLDNRVLIVELTDPRVKDVSIPFQAFINPEIVESSEDLDCIDEGCLSVPKIELPVDRSLKIKIRAQDVKGKKFKLTAKGILARILQHEIDHLNGIIFTDRIKEKLYSDYPNLKKLKIVFTGSGKFAQLILEGLFLLGFDVFVITETGKTAGRDKKVKETPIAILSQRFDKSFHTTDNLAKDMALQEKIIKFCPDLLICADFGQIIPVNVLKMAKILSINIHPSLLPKYRGPTPIQATILNGDKETGVSIIRMDNEIDHGPILAQTKILIKQKENSPQLNQRLSVVSLKLLFEILPLIVNKELRETKQNDEEASFTKKLTKLDGEINWQKPLVNIQRQIRAYYPWPGSFTSINGKRLIIHKAHFDKKNDRLRLDLVQIEGKKPMKWAEFLRGYRGEKPKWFEKVV